MAVRQKITKDLIVQGATRLIEEDGYDNFSLRELAYRLGVQPSALYRHLKNVRDLEDAIALCALETLQEKIDQASRGTYGKEKITAIAQAIRSYAKEQPGLFHVIEHSRNMERTGALFHSLRDALADFPLTEEEVDLYANALHAGVFGFITLERRGMLLCADQADAGFTTMMGLLLATLQPARRVN